MFLPPLEANPPLSELEERWRRCRLLLAGALPEAGGLLLFNQVSIYYLAGVMGTGVFWLPLQGEPLLFLRKGKERARLESPGVAVREFRSYSDLGAAAREHGSPFTPAVAAEQDALPWSLADKLRQHLPLRFYRADEVMARARAVKSPWELLRMREAGARHRFILEELLPARLRTGMSEMDVARELSDLCYRHGSLGLSRMSSYGEEMLLGEVCVGDNGNYPTVFNGPLGCRGAHPSCPYLGSDTLWEPGQLLMVDAGFCFAGYNSDKAQCYLAGDRPLPAAAIEAHAVCCEIEAAIAERLKPGAVPADLYALALGIAEKHGFAEGFMGLGANKVPFVGHGIGLCIDEWPVLARRFETPLEAGMCFALEPKIGIPGIGMVGVENTWEVREGGGGSLSGGTPRILPIS